MHRRENFSAACKGVEEGERGRTVASGVSIPLSLSRFFWPPPSLVSTVETKWKRSPEQNNSLSCWNRQCFTLVWGVDSSGSRQQQQQQQRSSTEKRRAEARPDNSAVAASTVCFEFLKRSAMTAFIVPPLSPSRSSSVYERLWRTFSPETETKLIPCIANSRVLAAIQRPRLQKLEVESRLFHRKRCRYPFWVRRWGISSKGDLVDNVHWKRILESIQETSWLYVFTVGRSNSYDWQ